VWVSPVTSHWYVVCSALATDPDPKDRIWTLSHDPKHTGWNTNHGTPGYGMTKAQAQELADAANGQGEGR